MIESILPPGVAAADSVVDPPDAELFPEEEAYIARAVEKRRREFTTVRWCARRALDSLGQRAVALLPDRRGAPGWPDGVHGSMTHCAGYRAAAVAPTGTVAGIGIDAEPHEALPAGVFDTISLPSERASIRRRHARVHWDRLLFSAKESVFKAWYPMARRELGFSEAELDLDPGGSFTARLLVPGPVVDGRPVTGYQGRWRVVDGLILTAIVVPRRDAL
ncbi:4'-phosphopantetheinyl transferase family protein [Cryptosporangium japonicum]|uniref:4'-phosphopantetheinyl transferase family protein n=1 Tax=Cryptosporangium japonicum TaxID=80872 RepID=UPI0031E2A781